MNNKIKALLVTGGTVVLGVVGFAISRLFKSEEGTDETEVYEDVVEEETASEEN